MRKVEADKEKPCVSNRDKVRRPRKIKGLFWCDFCDAAQINAGNRCPNCKRRDGGKAFKK